MPMTGGEHCGDITEFVIAFDADAGAVHGKGVTVWETDANGFDDGRNPKTEHFSLVLSVARHFDVMYGIREQAHLSWDKREEALTSSYSDCWGIVNAADAGDVARGGSAL